jgi:Spy/CpxP family protein refolding chaperone
MTWRPVLAVILAAASLLAISAVNAQAPADSPAPSAAPDAPGSAQLSDQKLDAAAAAIARVAFLRQTYARQLAQADPADREEIAEQASGELAKAVNDQGLSVEEYNTIVNRARADPDVRKKILDRLQPPHEERAPSGEPPPAQ